MERPESITEERWAEIIDEANGLYYNTGWGIFKSLTKEEQDFAWQYVFDELGLDACVNCGFYMESHEFLFGECEECQNDALEEEDD